MMINGNQSARKVVPNVAHYTSVSVVFMNKCFAIPYYFSFTKQLVLFINSELWLLVFYATFNNIS